MDNNFATENFLGETLKHGLQECKDMYPELFSTHQAELSRQKNTLMMVASCSLVYPSVLACLGTPHVNVTAEGYPRQRFHAGCVEIDKVETLAIENAKKVFQAQYANVQAHSATTANEIVLYYFLNPGDTILGLGLSSGGHLSHGSNVSFSGTYFKSIKYGLDNGYQIDYDQVLELALEHRPKIIICGTTAYSRKIDFERFRDIADRVNALLLADISHISGLVITGLHTSPIDVAHITTTCTHKQLFGPRGGVILSGKESNMIFKRAGLAKPLKDHIQKAVFPFFQGAPILNEIAAKAMALQLAQSISFQTIMNDIVRNARLLADFFILHNYEVVSSRTDTHIVLLDLSNKMINGTVAEKALEECGIIVNKNIVPGCKRLQLKRKEPQGIRIGTNIISQRKFSEEAVIECATLIDNVIKNTESVDGEIRVNNQCKIETLDRVAQLCKKYPIPYC